MDYEKLIQYLRKCSDAVCSKDCPYYEDLDCGEVLMRNAADAIEDLMKKLVIAEDESGLYDALPMTVITQKSQWISVDERLPEEETAVLVVRRFLGFNKVSPCVYVEVAERIGDAWCSATDEYKIAPSRHTNPFAWMPLPEPPEDVDGCE
jgi:hypothetical protein